MARPKKGYDARPTDCMAALKHLWAKKVDVEEVHRVLPPIDTDGSCEVLYVDAGGQPHRAYVDRDGDTELMVGW